MPSRQQTAWLRREAKKVAKQASTYARPNIPSKTLRVALQVVEGQEPGNAAVFIPHYWAVFVHDGRRGFSMRPGAYLVWFRNPANDPRRPGGTTPERLRDMRRRTPQEFQYWMRQNRLADKVGAPRPMIVTRAVGPTRPAGFFDNKKGMAIFIKQAKRIMAEDFDRFVRQQLARLPKGRTIIVRI